ncbi:MAG: serpin family protein [Proteobacteria bacterium]|nr:serpin family protein [Pseudomonadota bacterium]
MPSFTATTSGTSGSLTITANLNVGDADAGQHGNVYLLANFNGGWYAHNGSFWVAWLGGSIPVYSTGSLTSRSIEVARNLDSLSLVGTQVILGYGLNEADMLANGKYGLIYVFPDPVTVLRSSLQRVAAPNVSDTDKTTLASGNTAFALDLYRKLVSDPAQSAGNIFFSPLSVSVALAMTYAGAHGATASEMAGALHFSLPQERLHPAFGWLDLQLMSRGQGAQGKDGQPFRLSVSNSLWGDARSRFEAPFLDTLTQYYGAGMNLVDFRTAPEPSRTLINDWVARKTEQRIKDLLPQGSLTPDTRLVLVNAVYFNAAWQSKFQKYATASAPFNRLDAATVPVDMMNQDLVLPYAAGADYQAAELPYDGGELGMLVILPAAGRYTQFEQAFDVTTFNSVLAALGNQYVRLGLPKFKVDGSFSVKAAMQSLGMQTAFTDRADFTGISTSEALLIQDIVHKSFADVDENGTEAAAATGVIMGTTSVPQAPTISFRADRPFLLFVLDKKTNTIVFSGRVVDPKS